ncbi:hypothetical protein E2542_SST04857 [Spatholobus suberectus]|nr:hypothetical protein E2542_SST04857 [Spatholobus suberectus]
MASGGSSNACERVEEARRDVATRWFCVMTGRRDAKGVAIDARRTGEGKDLQKSLTVIWGGRKKHEFWIAGGWQEPELRAAKNGVAQKIADLGNAFVATVAIKLLFWMGFSQQI